RKRAYCLKIQPAPGSFARNLIYSTKPCRRLRKGDYSFLYKFRFSSQQSRNLSACREVISASNDISLFIKAAVWRFLFAKMNINPEQY
ncbi:hypothetical protein, partial [Escherichia coli]|uniref:hypothetical protein n=1 Tax=Escherichia coli TaxID=562 RepID=UPI001BEC1CFF